MNYSNEYFPYSTALSSFCIPQITFFKVNFLSELMTFKIENVSAVIDEYKNHVESQFHLRMDLCPHV